jgi:DNA-binding response OmpR family regulator
MKLLIIEDEPGMRENMLRSLQQEHYVVETACDYDSARQKLGIYHYDCILLDIGLPGGTGFELLEELKNEGRKDAVLIVSAKDSIQDKVAGLDLGADDYLSKPFHFAELHARVKSLLRRKSLNGSNVITVQNIVADTTQRSVSVNGIDLPLNRKEYEIIVYLLINKDRLVNKAALAEHVWGDKIDEANSFDFIYSQIKNLRKKLRDNNASVELKAVYGIGYKLTES